MYLPHNAVINTLSVNPWSTRVVPSVDVITFVRCLDQKSFSFFAGMSYNNRLFRLVKLVAY